jgi:hypothetical protein
MVSENFGRFAKVKTSEDLFHVHVPLTNAYLSKETNLARLSIKKINITKNKKVCYF